MMKCRNRIVAFLALLSLSATEAREVGGLDIPESQDNLQLLGAGVLRKAYFFKVYVGAFYVEDTADLPGNLPNIRKRIDIHYFHHTPKKYMIEAANKALEKNLTTSELNVLKPMIERLNSAFLDGQNGAVASLVHQPGEGLTYFYNGKSVLNLPGDRIANAYFSVWLGEHPSSQSMKNALLGSAEEKDSDG